MLSEKIVSSKWRTVLVIIGLTGLLIGYDMVTSSRKYSPAADWPSQSASNNVSDIFQWKIDRSCRLSFEFGGRVSVASNRTGIDGQKAVCLDRGFAPPSGLCIIYSFSPSGERSFEQVMESYGCDVYAFDAETASDHDPRFPHLHSFKFGLAAAGPDTESDGLYSLRKIRSYLRHAHQPIDYLKLELSGDELPKLEYLLENQHLKSVKQLGIKFRRLERPEEHRLQRQLLKRLEKSRFVRFFSRENYWTKDWLSGNKSSCGYETAWFNADYSQEWRMYGSSGGVHQGAGSWKDMLTYFDGHDASACRIYFELGGVLSRQPGLTFLDGQKAVCFDGALAPRSDGRCIVYSFGSNGEWSFDEQMERYGCKVYCFDPSVGYRSQHHSKNVLFYRIGISDHDEERNANGWRMATLSALRRKLHHVDDVIDYLKMDVEGAEWAVLQRWIQDGDLSRVKQLAVEVHLEEPDSIPWKYSIIRQLESSGFVRFFSRPNPWSAGVYLDQFNVSNPSCYELAWYNSKFLTSNTANQL